MYQLTNEFQQLLQKYNLKVDGYLFEHNKFQSFNSEDFNQEVTK